jgi:hypothetical protein
MSSPSVCIHSVNRTKFTFEIYNNNNNKKKKKKKKKKLGAEKSYSLCLF